MKNYEYNIVFPPNIEEGDDDLSPDEAERMIEFIHTLAGGKGDEGKSTISYSLCPCDFQEDDFSL